ncbi:MAG: EthD family reductase [Chloroflexi bacterium]|nr:EthD family reductase [Chloroflexota bacterium]
MDAAPVIHIAATECAPEVEAKFNRWYNEVHVPMSLKFEGMKGVTRYRLITRTEGHPRYLSICSFESKAAFDAYEASPERAAAFEEMSRAWQSGGFEIKWRLQYEMIKAWRK